MASEAEAKPNDPTIHPLWPLVVVLGEIAARVARQRAAECAPSPALDSRPHLGGRHLETATPVGVGDEHAPNGGLRSDLHDPTSKAPTQL